MVDLGSVNCLTRTNPSVLLCSDPLQPQPGRHPDQLLGQLPPRVGGRVVLEGYPTDREPRGLAVALEIDPRDEAVAEQEGQDITAVVAWPDV